MRLRAFALLACVAVVGMAACSEDPTEAGNLEPSAIVTNLSTTTRTVGTDFSITAYTIDKNNARIPGALTASGSGITVDSTPYFPELQETRVFAHATAISTDATITITGGNLSKTVSVSAFPASLDIQIADEAGSGEVIPVVVNALSSTGASLGPVSFSVTSSATSIVFVSSAGELLARGIGTATLTFTGPGGVTGTATVTVVPGLFTGTVTPGPLAAGQALTFTAAEGVPFDTDTQVSFDMLDPTDSFLVSRSETQLVVLVPANLNSGNFTLSNVGANQLALVGSFTPAVIGDPTEPANDSPATAPAIAPGVEIFGQVSAGDADDFFTLVVAAETTYRLDLDWTDTADVDAAILRPSGIFGSCNPANAAGDFLGCAAATGDKPETGTVTLAAGTYRVLVELFSGGGDAVQYRLKLTQQ